MTLIEPVSSLSIKRAVNLYTIVLFLSFGILLYWLASERYQVFVDFHMDTANNTTKIIAFEIKKSLKEKQRIIDIFIESHKDLIITLSENPEDEDIQQELDQRLRKYQPDFFAFNLMTLVGVPVVEDFDDKIGEICLQDLQLYIKNGKQNIRIHPNSNAYHFDIIRKFSHENTNKLFFVSFKVNDLAELLNSTQPEKHSLIIINKDQNNLIEITSLGSRLKTKNRYDFRMSGDENRRTLSMTKVKDTNWHVVDMRDEGLFDSYQKKIIKEYLIAFYVFAIIALFMRSILINQDEKRTAAEKQLQKNHQQIKDLNKQLEQLSRIDSLTGLYNRRFFDQMINQEWNRGQRSEQTLSCILLDVDYFKNYNDLYGHQAGDKCLKAVSHLMKQSFKRASDIVARYGGEEFIILMSESSKQDMQTAMERFQKELEDLGMPHQNSAAGDHVTVSAGLVNQVPSKDESIEDFIRKADQALYRAKSDGRNRWVVHEENVDGS